MRRDLGSGPVFAARLPLLLPNLDASANRLIKLLWIGIGSDDPSVEAHKQLNAYLDSRGVKYTYTVYPNEPALVAAVAPDLRRVRAADLQIDHVYRQESLRGRPCRVAAWDLIPGGRIGRTTLERVTERTGQMNVRTPLLGLALVLFRSR